MKVVIAGSRTLVDYEVVKTAIKKSGMAVSVVFSGHCRGADRLGELYAKEHGLACQLYLPEWAKYGRAAGPKRNAAMLADADVLIAILKAGAANRGTLNIIEQARKIGVLTYVHSC